MSIWSHLLCKPHMAFLHVKCRETAIPYLRSNVFRLAVPEEKIKWSVEWKEYDPQSYTDPGVEGKPWADEEKGGKVRWNAVDGQINRKSHVCDYAFDADLRPLNPMGRTGLRGRGLLGRWGPNHAADPVVTRIHNGELQFVAIQRRDTGEWAIPGGMVDAGELVSQTLRREFTEEALGSTAPEKLDKLWENGTEVFRGYVDDPRNTDNAWMETVVTNFHDHSGLLADVSLQAGDDAANVRWVAVSAGEKLYASHANFIELVKHLHNV